MDQEQSRTYEEHQEHLWNFENLKVKRIEHIWHESSSIWGENNKSINNFHKQTLKLYKSRI